MCPYTSDGHCGIIENKLINNVKSITRLGEIALAYAQAGKTLFHLLHYKYMHTEKINMILIFIKYLVM